MTEERKAVITQWCIGILAFLVMFVIYYQVHPLVPYDEDDWINLSMMRLPFPLWHSFNPIKILPEDGFPLMGYFGAYVMAPLLGDYVNGIRFSASLFISVAIGAYMALFFRMVKNRFSIGTYNAIILTCLFFLFHFLIFKSRQGANFNLFSEANLTCIYHYTLSAVVNGSLVLYFMAHHGIKEAFQQASLIKKSLLILWIYLAICSNVLQNEMLTAYVGMILVWALWESRHEFSIKDYMIKNKIELMIILFWLIALFFEAHGGRANHIGVSLFAMPIGKAFHVWLGAWKGMSVEFLIITGVIILYAAIAYGRTVKCNNINLNDIRAVKKVLTESLKICLPALILIVIYLVLFGAKAGTRYLTRPGVLFPIAFYMFLSILALISFGMKLAPKIVMIAPVFLLAVLIVVVKPGKYFRENTIGYVSGYKAMAVSRDLITQIQTADREQKERMILYVPKGNSKDNWPHPFYMGQNISRTLFYHGLISKPVKIKIQPVTDMNTKYGIPIPKQ